MYVYTISQFRWGHCEGNFGNSEFQPNYNNGGTLVMPDSWCVGDRGGIATGTNYEDYFDNRLQLMNQYGGRLAANGYESSTVGFNWAVGEQNVCYLGTDIFYQESGATFPY